MFEKKNHTKVLRNIQNKQNQRVINQKHFYVNDSSYLPCFRKQVFEKLGKLCL